MGFVHRDIKPANIIRSRDKCYLIDFGFAYHCEDTEDWKAINCGTYCFMPVKMNGGPHTALDDMESFMYTLVYLVVGFIPWEVDDSQPLPLVQMSFAKANFYFQYLSIIRTLQSYIIDESVEEFLFACKSTFTNIPEPTKRDYKGYQMETGEVAE